MPSRTPTTTHPRTVLITGCSPSSLGESLALAFHALPNTKVYATARSVDKLSSLATGGIATLALDVTKPETIAVAANQVEKDNDGCGLDILVNCSGVGYTMPLLDVDISVARETFEVNFFGVISAVQGFSPLLIKARGTIINISSIAGELSPPWQTMYNASKAALNSMSDGLRVELDPFGVTVITVIAGGLVTGFVGNRPPVLLPVGSLYKPIEEEIMKDPQEAMSVKMHDPAEFARRVVANAVNVRPSTWWWGGALSTTVWVVVTFLWHGATVCPGDRIVANIGN
jgi:1-acylglycerone phosphate reductase